MDTIGRSTVLLSGRRLRLSTSAARPTLRPFHVKPSSREMMAATPNRRHWLTPATTSTSLHGLWMTTP
ncbi:hypothetical protein [Kribbella swartbergensis]